MPHKSFGFVHFLFEPEPGRLRNMSRLVERPEPIAGAVMIPVLH